MTPLIKHGVVRAGLDQPGGGSGPDSGRIATTSLQVFWRRFARERGFFATSVGRGPPPFAARPSSAHRWHTGRSPPRKVRRIALDRRFTFGAATTPRAYAPINVRSASFDVGEPAAGRKPHAIIQIARTISCTNRGNCSKFCSEELPPIAPYIASR
jgi:hypothetical protein